MHFPLPYIPDLNYLDSRGWNADRANVAKANNIPGGVLKHAACDLVAPPGTPVLAVADGIVRDRPQMFYPFITGRDVVKDDQVTYAFSIRHVGGFIARYCEVDLTLAVKVGQIVEAGQVIAWIGDQPGDPGYDMLHFEMFSGHEAGPLSTAKILANAPFFRRKDVINPTPFLDQWRHTARWKKQSTYKYVERNGGKFLESPVSQLLAHPVRYERMPQKPVMANWER